MENKIKNFKSVNLDISKITPVEKVPNSTGFDYPVIFKAKEKYVLLNDWLLENKDLVNDHLSKEGAVLFRNFNMDIGDAFREVVSSHGKAIEYDLGAANRSKIIDNIYISTFHPKEEDLEMHNEMSYTSHWPKELMLYCQIPSEEGGETPLCDGRLIWGMLKEETKKKFEELSIMYVRKLGGLFGGLTWQKVFNTSDKKIAENKCRESDIAFEWLGEDVMVMKWVKPATIKHPVSNETAWFNHCFFFNSIVLNQELKSVMNIDDIPFYCYYGDGSAIETEVLEELKNAFEKTKSAFVWEKGDVLLIDNILLSHGRNSFKGERKVLAAMF